MGPNKECYATQEVQRRVQGRSCRTGAIVIKQWVIPPEKSAGQKWNFLVPYPEEVP